MNRYWTYLLGLVLVLGIGLMVSCGGDDDIQEPEPDPCEGKAPVSAAFLMEEAYRDLDFEVQFYETDTIVPNTVRFTALEEDAQYFWEIGAGTYTERSFSLFFPASTIGEVIPISLKVIKDPDTLCFPDDPGIDSLSRNLYVVTNCGSAMNGTFLGERSDRPGEEILIELELIQANETAIGCMSLYLSNMDGAGCERTYTSNIAAHKRFLFQSSNVDCDGGSGLIRIENYPDSIFLDMRTSPGGGVRHEYTFKGKRQ